MSYYVARRNAALLDARQAIEEADRLIVAEGYAQAAGSLREAASALDRAATEQHCIDVPLREEH